MNDDYIKNMIVNASLLLSFSVIYSSIQYKIKKQTVMTNIFWGLSSGFIGILLFITAAFFDKMYLFDEKTVLISITGMFFGTFPVCISVFILSAVRIAIGGPEAAAGVLIMAAMGVSGLIWRRFRLNSIISGSKFIYADFYVFGLATHALLFIFLLLLPAGRLPAALTGKTLRTIGISCLFIHPSAMFLVGTVILFNIRRQRSEKESDVIREELEASLSGYKNLYHEHKNRELLLQSLFNSTDDMMFYKDMNGVFLGCNTAFEKFIGTKEAELAGHITKDIFNADVMEASGSSDSIMINEKRTVRYEQALTYPNGDNVIVETLKTPYYDESGSIQGVICVARDITGRKKKEDDIIYLSHHDTMTGLYNRTFYEKEKGRLDIKENLPLSVIVCDVNGLKLINDAFGYSEGDAVLVRAAEILKSCCREKDIVARTGGDEFCILLPETDDIEVTEIFDLIKAANAEINNKSDHVFHYASISVGYATKTNEHESLGEVTKSAEGYMYRRKMLSNADIHSVILKSITTTLHEKSYETQEHGERMTSMAKRLGQILGLNYSDLDTLELASSLHDIGKISIDLSILNKREKLTADDWEKIKKHPEVGCRIAQAIPELQPISEIILSHHERWDGKGYPRGIAGKNIPLAARIISIIDSYDAMTHDRGYRTAMTEEDAAGEILSLAGVQYDPEIAEIFVKQVLAKEYENKSCGKNGF